MFLSAATAATFRLLPKKSRIGLQRAVALVNSADAGGRPAPPASVKRKGRHNAATAVKIYPRRMPRRSGGVGTAVCSGQWGQASGSDRPIRGIAAAVLTPPPEEWIGKASFVKRCGSGQRIDITNACLWRKGSRSYYSRRRSRSIILPTVIIHILTPSTSATASIAEQPRKMVAGGAEVS